MDLSPVRKHPSFLIVVILLLFMGFTLVIRMIPAFFIKDPGFLYIYDTDSWYTLRQVEVMVRDFPQFNWFDPMTAFPEGKTIDWGPLYPFIAATLILITGATTRSGIIFTSGWIGPLMAVVMVPVMYQLGKTLWNWKAGIISAGLISVVSIPYFSISSYGWVDHHIAEVLFSTLFFLSYISTIVYIKDNPVDWKKQKTFMFPVLLSVFTGIMYFLGLLSSTTVILVLIVIAVYTFIQTILDYFSGRPSGYLLILNLGFLGVSTVFLFLFGFKQPGVSLIQYSIGIVYVSLALIGETVLLYTFSRIFHGKKSLFVGSFAILGVMGIYLIQAFPVLQSVIDQATGLIFGFSAYSVGVVETLPWTLSGAWENFSIALILMAGGLLILIYSGIKKRDNQSVFLLVWSLVMIFLTFRFQRFSYFFTVNVVLLASIGIVEPIRWREPQIKNYLTSVFSRPVPGTISQGDNNSVSSEKPAPVKGKKGKQNTPKRPAGNPVNFIDTLKDFTAGIIIILAISLVAISLYDDIQYSRSTPFHEISPDWVESLEWLQENTPQTGIDYFRQYEMQGFSYPAESYGIMAVWDAGHWITFIAHRIPITNPFQNSLDGPGGAAAFFLNGNESKSDAILQNFRGKYVITDSKMAVDTFTNLVPWQSASVDISPYIKWFLVPDTRDSSRLIKVHRFDDKYFQTLVVRLHSFDGSMTLPNTVVYTEYEIRQVPAPGENAGDVHGYARVIAKESEIDISNGLDGRRIINESAELVPTRYANIFSDMPNRPLQKVPALVHYRLIHESPDNASVTMFPESTPVTVPGMKSVKIFEFVRGAQIPGEGIIELPVVTNTGRIFVYRQESEGGMFTVPYSTKGNPYDVHATGQYHIAGTNQYFNVTEDDVIQGNRVTG